MQRFEDVIVSCLFSSLWIAPLKAFNNSQMFPGGDVRGRGVEMGVTGTKAGDFNMRILVATNQPLMFGGSNNGVMELVIGAIEFRPVLCPGIPRHLVAELIEAANQRRVDLQ